MVKEVPLFDSVKAALEFALNAADVSMPRPFMNKAMAEAPVKKPRKRKPKPGSGVFEVPEPEERKRTAARQREALGGMDKSHLAGFIVSKLETLDAPQVAVLKGLVTRASDPCACRAPCCSGYRVNTRWAKAVADCCQVLKESGDVLKKPGRRGLSTQPNLRALIVSRWLTGADYSTTALAKECDVSVVTARQHIEWITTYLEQVENEAWQQIALVFDQAGITGFMD